jgi:hypothetical protein
MNNNENEKNENESFNVNRYQLLLNWFAFHDTSQSENGTLKRTIGNLKVI